MARRMKDSGVAWIGQVPEEWAQRRIAALYRVRNTKCSDKKYAPLSVTMKGIVPQLEDVAKTDDGDNRKLVLAGDFVINSRSDRRGSCGISPLNGSVSLINTVLEPRNEMTPGYFSWLFRSFAFADEFYANGHGIVDDLWTTRWQDMKKIVVPFPPLPEQRQIAAVLDRECGKIDALTEKIREEIAKLGEYKKSVITEAVTGQHEKGPKKPSGVAWIGDVPEGWTVSRFKFIFDEITDGSHFSPPSVELGKPYITATDVRGVGINFENTLKISQADYQRLVSSGCKIQKDDVLLVKDGATTGRVGLMVTDEECVALSSVAMLRSKKSCSKFLMYLLQSDFVQKQILLSMAGAAMPRTTVSKIGEYVGIAPPGFDQQRIADSLDSQCGKIDALVAAKERELEKLAELKKSLIFEYVTGKRPASAVEPLRRGEEVA